VLGEIPIVEEIRTGGDEGKPIVLQAPDHAVSRAFHAIANRVIQASPNTLH